MALIAPAMSLQVSVSDVAARIQQSQNGLILNLPVSLNVPIVELLDALQSVQQKNGEPLPESKVAPPQELAPGIQPPPNRAPDMPPPPISGVEVEPTGPLQFRLPMDNAKWHEIDNAKWHEICSSGAQTFTSLHGWKTYDIRSSKKKWILDQQDFAVLDDLKIQRKEPMPMKRMAPTPKVDDLAAVEARAEEAFKKAMELPMAAQSSLRLPPETPPPASSLPPVSHPMTFKDSGPDEAAIIRSRGSDEADPMKRPLSAVAVPMPGHGGHGSGRPATYADMARVNALNLEPGYAHQCAEPERITVEQPGGLQGKRTRRSGQWHDKFANQWQKRLEERFECLDDAATDAEAEATPGDVAEAEAAAADQTGSTGRSEELGTPQWNKQRKECQQQ